MQYNLNIYSKPIQNINTQNMNNWGFSKPEFIFNNEIPDFTWAGHTFFAYDLVKNFKPDTIVELGTYKGTSALSFCQGVEDAKLNTDLYFVDNWQGEEQTGFYTEDVYVLFTNFVKKYFKDLKVHPMKMYFDEALNKFDDKSIDILHIDGLHTYEAVKHDYDTWKSKVKDNGVLLFHDIKVPNYGVKDVWEEVKRENEGAIFIEFEHNYGLGVVIKDKSLKKAFTPETISRMLDYYYGISSEYRLKQRVIELEHYSHDLEDGSKHLDKMLHDVMEENTKLYRRIDKLMDLVSRRPVKVALGFSRTIRKLRNKLP